MFFAVFEYRNCFTTLILNVIQNGPPFSWGDPLDPQAAVNPQFLHSQVATGLNINSALSQRNLSLRNTSNNVTIDLVIIGTIRLKS